MYSVQVSDPKSALQPETCQRFECFYSPEALWHALYIVQRLDSILVCQLIGRPKQDPDFARLGPLSLDATMPRDASRCVFTCGVYLYWPLSSS